MSNKVKIIIGLAAIAIIAAMVVVNLRKSRGEVIEITSTEVKRGDISRTVSGSGKVQPVTDIKIAARISAEIKKIHVKEGDAVKQGQLLVELDRASYAAYAEQIQSQLSSAKAAVKKADADYARIKGLFDKNLASQAELDAAEATRMSAAASLDQARAALKQANDDLDKTRLLSPIDGTVTKLNKEEGEIAVGSQFQADIIMNLANLKDMEVLADIDENEVVLVHLGDKTTIEVDAIPDTTFQGRVTEIAHVATTTNAGTQEQVTNFEVKIGVTSDVAKLRPGMSATVDILTETRPNVLYVPIQSVTARDLKADSLKNNTAQKKPEKDTASSETNAAKKSKKESKTDLTEIVFVVQNGTVKAVPVKTGISDDNNIEIISGLTEGQKVVTGSYKALSKLLKDGSQVKEKKSTGVEEEEAKK
ncbi:MAG TPA: efflux RND transporter periplasmic adaptor subunit [bacterium]|nr:efflux RND transporter periplasmic adaptor subunit [bacterium]HQG45415.1 efflux RND transporter periplasmic adaptor subunit [bacterium]HQI47130.1 efflux RND transporter periplasmic adaptor subunit [bacterium]HQJ63152.1 efflux RND transporter periplasmic adaptor subunit [bacterium]